LNSKKCTKIIRRRQENLENRKVEAFGERAAELDEIIKRIDEIIRDDREESAELDEIIKRIEDLPVKDEKVSEIYRKIKKNVRVQDETMKRYVESYEELKETVDRIEKLERNGKGGKEISKEDIERWLKNKMDELEKEFKKEGIPVTLDALHGGAQTAFFEEFGFMPRAAGKRFKSKRGRASSTR
jgi:predicted RNase H-like nuclease (RuvC/YqgF family)